MKRKTTSGVAVGLIWLSCSACIGHEPPDLTPSEVASLLRQAGVGVPWHVEQIPFSEDRTGWDLLAYRDPRQIAPDICLDGVDVVEVLSDSSKLRIGSKNQYWRMLLSTCKGARSLGFGQVNGALTEERIQAIPAVIKSVFKAAANPAAEEDVRIEPDALRGAAQIERETFTSLHWISNDEVEVAFFARNVAPQEVVFELQYFEGTARVTRIYLQSGPDVAKGRGD